MVQMDYLEAGKLGLKELMFAPECLQPAPLSPDHENKMLQINNDVLQQDVPLVTRVK